MEQSQRYYLCQHKGIPETNAIVKAVSWSKGCSITEADCLDLFVNTLNVDKNMSVINAVFEPETSYLVEAGIKIIQF